MISEMAFNSGKCVSCTEPTKRNAGKYRGKDEKGNYSGPMYICDNPSCSINYERRKIHKQVIVSQEKKLQDDRRISNLRGNDYNKKRRRVAVVWG